MREACILINILCLYFNHCQHQYHRGPLSTLIKYEMQLSNELIFPKNILLKTFFKRLSFRIFCPLIILAYLWWIAIWWRQSSVLPFCIFLFFGLDWIIIVTCIIFSLLQLSFLRVLSLMFKHRLSVQFFFRKIYFCTRFYLEIFILFNFSFRKEITILWFANWSK